MPRQQIKDEYEIIGEIGTGGMATVYKAVQRTLDRPVAIPPVPISPMISYSSFICCRGIRAYLISCRFRFSGSFPAER